MSQKSVYSPHYHPSEIRYEGATVGGVSTGGFRTTDAYYTDGIKASNNGLIVIVCGKSLFQIEKVTFDEEVQRRLQLHPKENCRKYGSSNGIRLIGSGNSGIDPLTAQAAMSLNSTQRMALFSQMSANSKYLSLNTCNQIVDVLKIICSEILPYPTESLYNSAVSLLERDDLASISGAQSYLKKIGSYKDSELLLSRAKEKYDRLYQESKEKAIIEKEKQAKKTKKNLLIAGIIVGALIIIAAAVFVILKVIIPSNQYKTAETLLESSKYQEAMDAFEALSGYKDSNEKAIYAEACILLEEGDKPLAAMTYYSLGDFSDAKERSFAIWDDLIPDTSIAAGGVFTIGLKNDGTVLATGSNMYGQCDVQDWSNIISVAAGAYHSVGLKADGTVVAVGNNDYGQCDVALWKNIVAIDAGELQTVGLKADGTVVATGLYHNGEDCHVNAWRDVVMIDANRNNTVGLKADGTVVIDGSNEYGQCYVDNWTNIISIAAGSHHTVGLMADGSVRAVGDDYHGQSDVDGWQDICQITASMSNTVGLKKDGTVIAVGNNKYGQSDVSGWKDVVAVNTLGAHTVGVKEDGTAVATGDNSAGQCDVSDWKDIKLP